MKWGRRTSSPPSFGSSVITRVLPASWFSKFKQTGGSLDTAPGKKQQRGKLDFSTVNSSLPTGCRQARFYRLDDDAYWTLSFRKDRGVGVGGREGRKRNSRINPLWYDSDDEFLVAVSGFRETQLLRKELETIPETDTIKMKQERCTDTTPREKKRDKVKKKKTAVRRSRKLRSRVKRKDKKAEFGTGHDEGENESSSPEEEQVSPTQLQKADQMKEESHDSAVSNSRNHQNISSQTFGWSSDGEDDEEDHVIPDLDGKGSAEISERLSTLKCQDLENMKIQEFKEKTEEFRKKSAYISRIFRSRKVKRNRKNARGTRTECRIQALKGMESKKERESKEEAAESSTIYNSFAVVKSSFDPQQDFRDSMVEMIQEKGIRHREELQELLACYLSLNSDRHHDLIINVFQQVWSELQFFEE